MKYKTCIKCNEMLPATTEYFYKHKTTKDGLMGQCKGCKDKYNKNNPKNKEHKKRYYEKNKEKILEQHKKYQEENRTKIAEMHHKYYIKNKERLNSMNKDNYRKNKKRYREYSYKWARNNPEKKRIACHKRRARIRKLTATLTVAQWERIIKDFNYKCAYCGQELPLEQEHFIPITNHGEYTHNNIIPACKSCNSSKCNRDFFEWYIEQDFYSKEREEYILRYLNYTEDGKQQLSFVMGL